MKNNLDKIIITSIEEIITISSPKGRYEEINNRKWYGLSFCQSGQITYTQNSKKYVSDTSHAIILPQGKSYTLHGDKKGVFPVINFTCTNKLCDEIAVLPISSVDVYVNDYEMMKALSIFEGNNTKIMSIFYDLMHRLSLENIKDKKMLLPAIKYIEKNFHKPEVTNKLLAQKCDISEVYFRKLFFDNFKTTPKQYIIDIRINKAKQLLTDGVLKINVISEKCGFSNPYHFCRVFRQKVGLTPTEYMKQNRIYKI